ncbi:methyltransferase domain-containing protein [Colletotrichum graminicola]|uniref:Methyltransferase domain-containing protein n=1 Tax=Colletotrichum graminicola (strain M1.001 / M2 / FGSC 10212) TaxID=645133 RepID=E3R0E5_COLGM|nr:methyltransferase domain-containing protein [Colletotrichum graminicola M1.001]EFQ36583.1 methyltransferase domain-containing protein [Colletotrichum graminicola M1.001]WDK17181.1 methyltransferase domain-containing protein [Colletotrichum graminicola]
MTTKNTHPDGPKVPIFRAMDKTIGSHWEETMIDTSRTILGPLNARLVSQMGLGAETHEPIAFLDSACGAGPATQELYKAVPRQVFQKSEIVCGDESPMMVDLVKKRIKNEQWAGAQGRVIDATDSGLESDSFTHVVISLGLHVIPRPDTVIKDVVRILRPGGVFGCVTPHADHTSWVVDMRTAFASLPFEAPFPEKNWSQVHKVGRWYDEAWVRTYLLENGFCAVEVRVERGTMPIRNAKHWLDIFGPATAYLLNIEWSEELRAAHGLEEVKALIGQHLEDKYGGKGWEMGYACIVASGVVRK